MTEHDLAPLTEPELAALLGSARRRLRGRDEEYLRRLVAERDRLRTVLQEMVDRDGEPCRYDHNGFCQSHYSGRPCTVERARVALG